MPDNASARLHALNSADGQPLQVKDTNTMKAMTFATMAVYAAAAGWAFSMPEASPANGWLIALGAAVFAWLRAARALMLDEVR